MKKTTLIFMTALLICSFYCVADSKEPALKDSSVISSTVKNKIKTEIQNSSKSENTQNLLGGLSPKEAFEYMKKTKNLVIVEVNTAEWKKRTGFTGAMWIPHNEMAKRYNEIPKNRPVLLHCGGGIVSVPAYKTLIEKRPDIPELGYIAGAPLIKEYNEWLSNK